MGLTSAILLLFCFAQSSEAETSSGHLFASGKLPLVELWNLLRKTQPCYDFLVVFAWPWTPREGGCGACAYPRELCMAYARTPDKAPQCIALPADCYVDVTRAFCPNEDKVFRQCGSACPRSCDRLSPTCGSECASGCFCEPPRVLDRANGSLCVLERFCPFVLPPSTPPTTTRTTTSTADKATTAASDAGPTVPPSSKEALAAKIDLVDVTEMPTTAIATDTTTTTTTSTTTKKPMIPRPRPPPKTCVKDAGGKAEIGDEQIVRRRLWKLAKNQRRFVQVCGDSGESPTEGRWLEVACLDESGNRLRPTEEYLHKSGYFTVRCVRYDSGQLSLDIVKCVSDGQQYRNNTEWAGLSVVHRCVLHHDYDYLTSMGKDYSAAHEIVACIDDKGKIVTNATEWLTKDSLHFRTCEIGAEALEASQPITACVGQRRRRLDCQEDLAQFQRMGFGRYACEMCARTLRERKAELRKQRRRARRKPKLNINRIRVN